MTRGSSAPEAANQSSPVEDDSDEFCMKEAYSATASEEEPGENYFLCATSPSASIRSAFTELPLSSLSNFLDSVESELHRIVEPLNVKLAHGVTSVLSSLRKASGSSDAFFTCNIVSWPAEVLLIICQYYNACVEDRAIADKLRSAAGIFTSGKGVLAAMAISTATDFSDLPRTTAKMFLAAFFVGMQHHTYLSRYKEKYVGSFSLIIAGLPLLVTFFLLRKVNLGSTLRSVVYFPLAPLEVTCVFSNRTYVVSGHPVDISRLKVILKRMYFEGGHFSVDDLPEHGALHHSYLNRGVYYDLQRLWAANKVNLESDPLRVPIYSPATGRAWTAGSRPQRFGTLQQEIAFTLTCAPHNVSKTMGSVLRRSDRLIMFDNPHDSICCLLDQKYQQGFENDWAVKRPTSKLGIQRTLRKLAALNNIVRSICPSWPRLELTSSLHELWDEDFFSCAEDEWVDLNSDGALFTERGDEVALESKNRFFSLLRERGVDVDYPFLQRASTVALLLDLWDADELITVLSRP